MRSSQSGPLSPELHTPDDRAWLRQVGMQLSPESVCTLPEASSQQPNAVM